MKPREEIAMLREALQVERARADEAYELLDMATAAVKRAAAALRVAQTHKRAHERRTIDPGASSG